MNKQKYSSQDLNEFRTLIESKLKLAEENLGQLPDFSSDGGGTLEISALSNFHDHAAVFSSKEVNDRLIQRQQKLIEDLKLSLIRMNNGNYGICSKSGKLIPKERLLVVPYATCCVEYSQPIKKMVVGVMYPESTLVV